MKKTIKFAILSVIFTLCLCFAFLSNNFIGVYANESTDEILEEEIVEDEVVEEETVEEQKPEIVEETKQLEDWVVVIIGALMSLGVSWGSVLTIIKWIKNRLNTNKNNINEVIAKLKENQEEIETLKEVLKKLITDDKQLYDLLSEIKQDFAEFNNSEKEKTKIINTEISKILKKEDEVNE